MIRRIVTCCLVLCALATVLAAMLYLTHGWWLDRMGRWLVVDQQPVAVDAVVAVSGEHRRRQMAVDLYERNYARKLIFNVSDTTWYFGQAIDPVGSILEDMDRAGVPREAVIINRDVSSTWEDAQATLAAAREYGFGSLIVISDPLNMRRVKMTYDRVLATVGVEITYCSVPLEWDKLELERWWTREREMVLVFNEYLKILYYWVKYFL